MADTLQKIVDDVQPQESGSLSPHDLLANHLVCVYQHGDDRTITPVLSGDAVVNPLRNVDDLRHYAGNLAHYANEKNLFSAEQKQELIKPVVAYCESRQLNAHELMSIGTLCTADGLVKDMPEPVKDDLGFAIYRATHSDDEAVVKFAKHVLFCVAAADLRQTDRDLAEMDMYAHIHSSTIEQGRLEQEAYAAYDQKFAARYALKH